MLFSEGEPGVIRINLRGEGKITVLELAQKFGGGGHQQSAGVRVKNKPMEQVIAETVAAAESHLRMIGVL
jgi:nanoRNase/pAp phosphatase (c-di-AMP/oligoRNAs hydrolase)